MNLLLDPLSAPIPPLLCGELAGRAATPREDATSAQAAEMDAMDAAARASCRSLSEAFGIPSAHSILLGAPGSAGVAPMRATPSTERAAALPPAVSMGLEIETQWSAHFPELWERFGLAKRGIKALGAQELDALSLACSEREAVLLPRLKKTVECGIPRGNDRYWEFAFLPAANPDLLAEQIRLLSAAGLLPREGPRSLQITLGGLRSETDAVALAWLLAAFCVDSGRIRRGINLTRQIIHAGWARKGSAGVHEKTADELMHGARRAVEIRPLLLPATHSETLFLLRLASQAAAALALRQGAPSLAAHAPAAKLVQAWMAYRRQSERLLALKRMPAWAALAWETGRTPNYAAWEAFATGFDAWAAEARVLGRQFAALALGERER